MFVTFKKFVKRFWLPALAITAIILAVVFYFQLRTLKQDPQAQALKETQELVATVGKLVVLPADEMPTVATVSDPEALKDQTFFATAQKGDKVLIYAQAKKAILYSVTLNKILDVAPLNIGGSAAPAKAPATPAATPTPVKTP